MRNKLLLSTAAILPILIIGALAQQPAQDAPSGFNTPLVVSKPGSQSTSNGIMEPQGPPTGPRYQIRLIWRGSAVAAGDWPGLRRSSCLGSKRRMS